MLFEPVTSSASRTWWPFLLTALAISWLVQFRGAGLGWAGVRQAAGAHLWRTASARLDIQLLCIRQLLAALGLLPKLASAWLVATALVRALDAFVGRPELGQPPLLLLQISYSIVLFVVWDLSRYLLHRALHAWGPLWQFHQVHHSATVLTPFTFHRVHPVEALLYDLRGVLVTGVLAGIAYWLWRGEAVAVTVLGVDAIGFALNGLTGNLRHSHVWLSFGQRWERWFLSPAQHQLHHGVLPSENQCNYGVWLACWDRWAGSFRFAPKAQPHHFGLLHRDANHVNDLGSALLYPLYASGRILGRAFFPSK